jgi:sugar lactone lactonase YvrE
MHQVIASQKRRVVSSLLTVALGMVACASASGQTPAAVFSHANIVTVTNSTFKNGPYLTGTGAATGHVAANSRGDVFFIDGVFGYPTPAFLVEIPATGGPYVQLLSNIGNGPRGLTVDSKKNIYLGDNNNKNIYYIPFINNGYPSNIDATTVLKCTLPVSTNVTTCKNPFSLPAAIGYYLLPQDIALDAAGNAYIVDISDGLSGGAYFRILKASSTTGVLTIMVDQLPKATQPQIAADSAGNVYYVDGTNAYYYAAGATYNASTGTNTTFGTGLSKPGGVGIDASGNLYIADTGNSRIVEIPYVSGSRSNANQFVVSNQLATTGLGEDGYGNVYYGGSGGNGIYHLGVGSLNLGTVAVGTATAAQNLDLYFVAPATFGSFSVLGGSGTVPFTLASNACTVGKSYATGTSCSVTITYKATQAGPETGKIRAFDNNGVQLAEASLAGFGQAPVFDIDPGISSAIGSGWTAPSAIALDAAGNTYIADSSNGTIYKNGTSLLTGFTTPTAVAVDGAGSLYIAETGNHRVLKVPYAAGAYGASTVLYSGITGTAGLVLDASGNLYVADSGNSRVLLLSTSGNLPDGSLVTTVGTGFTTPIALALDGANNLYVSDSGAKQVVQVAIPTGGQTSVVTGMTTPAGVAVDPSGSLYAVDSGKQTVVRVPYTAGAINPALQMTLTSAVTNPYAIAADALGNLYLVDTKAAAVAKVNRSTGALAFGIIDLAATSPTLSAIISDAGTTALTLSTPYYTATGNSSSFVAQPSSTCANGAVLATGGSCKLDEIFTPPGIGPQTATLTFASNAAPATLVLTGTGFRAVVASISGASSIVYGTTTVYTVTAATDGNYVVSITGSASATTSVTVTGGTGKFTLPGIGAGSYTISVIGTTASTSLSVSTAPLTVTAANATRVYGAANPLLTATVTGAVNGDVLTATASTTANLTTPVGTYPIVPAASGSGIANYTVTPVNGVLTITQAATTSAVTASPTVVYAGSQITLTATVRSNTTGTPTGFVTFFSNNAVLGTSGLTNGTASYITSKTLTTGLYSITASYTGDTNFFGSTSAITTITISPPDFTLTTSATALTVQQGQSATATLTVTPINGFSQDVVFACSNLPLEASCSYAPATVNPGSGPVTSVFTITTRSTTTASVVGSSPWTLSGAAAFAVMLFCFTGRWRDRRFRGRLLLMLWAAALTLLPLAGCGSGSTSTVPVTPIGMTTITVTGQSAAAAIQHPITITVTVTN